MGEIPNLKILNAGSYGDSGAGRGGKTSAYGVLKETSRMFRCSLPWPL